MSYKHGKNGRVSVGATILKVTQWDGDDACPEVDATNTESGGFQELSDVGGIASVNGSVTAVVVDGSPPVMTPGTMVALSLYEGGKTSGYAFNFPSAYVSNVKRSNVVKGTDPITYSFDYKSSGTFTRPTA